MSYCISVLSHYLKVRNPDTFAADCAALCGKDIMSFPKETPISEWLGVPATLYDGCLDFYEGYFDYYESDLFFQDKFAALLTPESYFDFTDDYSNSLRYRYHEDHIDFSDMTLVADDDIVVCLNAYGQLLGVYETEEKAKSILSDTVYADCRIISAPLNHLSPALSINKRGN